jgi:hypothetical protein
LESLRDLGSKVSNKEHVELWRKLWNLSSNSIAITIYFLLPFVFGPLLSAEIIYLYFQGIINNKCLLYKPTVFLTKIN